MRGFIPQIHIVRVHHFTCIGECGRNFETTTLPEGKTIPKDKFICNECDPTMTEEKYTALLVDDEPFKDEEEPKGLEAMIEHGFVSDEPDTEEQA